FFQILLIWTCINGRESPPQSGPNPLYVGSGIYRYITPGRDKHLTGDAVYTASGLALDARVRCQAGARMLRGNHRTPIGGKSSTFDSPS
ncbi:MAG: hypothetical protein OXI44_00740, partial [Bacteroidota bacterium]|nr:hypothetical protein [Bacteroidota bacterium]